MSNKRKLELIAATGLASILVIAGVAKAQASSVQLLYFGLEPAQFAFMSLGVVEIVIGFLLVLRSDHIAVWRTVFIVFLSFALYSLWNLGSEIRCGCMGNINVSNRQIVWLNIIATGISGGTLYVNMVHRNLEIVRLNMITPILLSFSLLVAVLTGTFLGLDRQFSSEKLFVPNVALRANDYIPESGHISCIAKVYNLHDQEVRVVGWKPQCGTKYLARMPISLLPGEFTTVPIISAIPNAQIANNVIIPVDYFADVEGNLVEGSFDVRINMKPFKSVVSPRLQSASVGKTL